MKVIVATLLCIFIPLATFAGDKEPSYKATYDGGSITNVKAGSGLKLYLDATDRR